MKFTTEEKARMTMMPGTRRPVVSVREPSMEEEIAETISRERLGKVADEVASFAPPIHPDRISQVTKTMVTAIDKIYEDTARALDEKVREHEAMVERLAHTVQAFKTRMRSNADEIISKTKEAMAHFEDITRKMEESSLNSPLTRLLEKPKMEPKGEEV
jgi:hypothetical protein